MINVGLIGYGKWGKVLYSKLEKIYNIKFVCRSSDDYFDKLDGVDWVVVATPNHTHYDIVKKCLNARKNVFCEKPLTPTYKKSEELFKIADLKNVKLYVDDIQNYRKYNFEISTYNLVNRRKKGGGNIKDILYRLVYHDIYVLYSYIRKLEVEDIILIEFKDKLNFKVKFNGITIEFLYDLNSEKVEHSINGCDLSGKDDILTKMLSRVFNETVNFNYNRDVSLFTSKFIDLLNNTLFKRIAVVGGGIFGCTAASMLARDGYVVDLFERNDNVITQASYVNQYRLHRGYHYPRSKETAISSIKGENSFLKTYGDAVINGDVEHFYCIARENSLINSEEYKIFLDELNLKYIEKKLDLIHKNAVTLIVKVDELLFSPDELRKICLNRLEENNVNLKLNMDVNIDDLDNYNYIINATYANLNKLLPSNKHREYQFELCEKPVIKLPEQYKNKSIVIMDGPFMCIDPLDNTDYHVMGNVIHAIHSTNIGKFPVCDPKYEDLLNKGIVKNPIITNIDKFIESAKEFFVDLDKADHIGSMFTFRTVLPNREHDDARPTLVSMENDRLFNLFSGKIGTCVDAVGNLINKLENINE